MSVPCSSHVELEANGRDHEHKESLAEGAVEGVVEESVKIRTMRRTAPKKKRKS